MSRLALSHPNTQDIFQNSDDMQNIIARGMVDRPIASLIRGSGVDLELFRCLPEPPPPITCLPGGRMLRHSGVVEFVRAAQEVERNHPDWVFQLLRDVDPGNPASLTQDQLAAS